MHRLADNQVVDAGKLGGQDPAYYESIVWGVVYAPDGTVLTTSECPGGTDCGQVGQQEVDAPLHQGGRALEPAGLAVVQRDVAKAARRSEVVLGIPIRSAAPETDLPDSPAPGSPDRPRS